MANFTFAQREKQTRQMIKAIPAGACAMCLGSGLVDTVNETTGEIVPVLCRATPACANHADRVHAWFVEMLYWFFMVHSNCTRAEFDASLTRLNDGMLLAENARLRQALLQIANGTTSTPAPLVARAALAAPVQFPVEIGDN